MIRKLPRTARWLAIATANAPVYAAAHPTVAIITYRCAHSDAPFSDGHESSLTSVDLAAATRTDETTTVPPGDDKRAPGTPSKTTNTHVVTKLEAPRVAGFRTAANAVADGGPFKPEYPVPEGTSCALLLAGADKMPFFQIEKSDPHIDDAATRLVKLITR